jgi:predicted Fe-Mo cluster-binding NifX family protein
MLGGAMNALGGTDEIVSKISESGIDLSSLAEMDGEAVTAMLEEKGIDLSMLEGLGLSVEDVIAKVKEHLA